MTRKRKPVQLLNSFEAKTETGPSYWASYFVNGDCSGLNNKEIKLADAWRTASPPRAGSRGAIRSMAATVAAAT